MDSGLQLIEDESSKVGGRENVAQMSNSTILSGTKLRINTPPPKLQQKKRK